VPVGGTSSPFDQRFDPVGSIYVFHNADRYAGAQDWNVQARTVPVAVGQWQSIEITAIGRRITTSVGGQKVAEFVDDQPGCEEGQIVLVCRKTSVKFKNMMIQELNELGALEKDLSQIPVTSDISKEKQKLFVEGSEWSGIQSLADATWSGQFGLKLQTMNGEDFKGVCLLHDGIEIPATGTITGSIIKFSGKLDLYDINFKGLIIQEEINLIFEGINREGKPVAGTVVMKVKK
jgi:hypothetical protein